MPLFLFLYLFLRLCNKCQAFIHPVLPVLNETRRIVIAYNAEYRRQIKAVEGIDVVKVQFK